MNDSIMFVIEIDEKPLNSRVRSYTITHKIISTVIEHSSKMKIIGQQNGPKITLS